MSLVPPDRVQKLQNSLHEKAKESPSYRFYALYDKVYRIDILAYAYRSCKANGGAPGVDGQSFSEIERYGRDDWLGELAQDLKSGNYRAQSVKRVWIPKGKGQRRPLGIPTIRDRVVQTAMRLIVEPIFEADLPQEQYAYREGKDAKAAVRQVHRLVNIGYRDVVDADLSGYFDTIPHAELMKSLARRISDRRVLRLLKSWLVVAVEERIGKDQYRRTTRNKDERRGSPQGSPISPLLANLYMRRFILGWKRLGHEQQLHAKIVNYADDFVICSKGKATEAMEAMRAMMERLKLTVNEEKTQLCQLPTESVDFLGYTIGRNYSLTRQCYYLGTKPSKESVSKLLREISQQTSRRNQGLDAETMIRRLNRKLLGWSNYFDQGPVLRSYMKIDAHTRFRLRQWLVRKHKQRGRGAVRYPAWKLYREMGLMQLQNIRPDVPCAKS